MPAPHTTLAPRILLPPCSLVTLSSEVASTLGRSPAREISVGALRRAGPAGGGDGGIGHVPWVTTHLPSLGYYPPTLPGLLPTVSHGGTSTTDLTVHYYFSPLLYYPSLPVQSTTSRKVQNDRSTVINGSKVRYRSKVMYIRGRTLAAPPHPVPEQRGEALQGSPSEKYSSRVCRRSLDGC